LNGEAIQIDIKNVGKKLVFSMDRVKDLIPKIIKEEIKTPIKPPTTSEQIDTTNQVKIQGDLVRKMKSENASAVNVQLEIQKLLDLKKQLLSISQ
jgi:hypothetical protein